MLQRYEQITKVTFLCSSKPPIHQHDTATLLATELVTTFFAGVQIHAEAITSLLVASFCIIKNSAVLDGETLRILWR